MKMSLYIPPRSIDKESTSIKIKIKMPHNSGKSTCHSHPVAWVGIHNSFKGRRRELIPQYCPQTSTCMMWHVLTHTHHAYNNKFLKKNLSQRSKMKNLRLKMLDQYAMYTHQQLIILKNKGTLCLDWVHGLVSKVFPFSRMRTWAQFPGSTWKGHV